MDFETKSLRESGGHSHIRSQLIGNSDEKIDYKSSTAQPGYGLRENPKKTWRAEDLKTYPLINEQKEMICKQCGKGFQSMKALCGHMACHSEKDRFLKDDDSWVSERVEREDDGRKRPKRANIRKCKKGSVNCTFFNCDNSSSVSETDFDEEEVAMCLIMMSRDSWNFFGNNSNMESSDSVVLETKSSSFDTKKSRQKNQDCDYEIVEIEKLGKRKSRKDEYKGDEFGIGLSEGEECEKYDHKVMKFISKKKKKVKDLETGKKLKSKKKIKGHECPYCNRVFKSGQALGGHKRTHFLGNNSGNRNNVIPKVVEAETSEVKDLFDLNLPASEEEEKEESEHSQFVNWSGDRKSRNRNRS